MSAFRRPLLASFNVWGVESSRDVGATAAKAFAAFDWGEVWCVAFQEVWYRAQLAALDAVWLGSPTPEEEYRPADAVYLAWHKGGAFTRILPDAAPMDPLAKLVGKAFDLSSGLVLYTPRKVVDARYEPFVVKGDLGDSLAQKGWLRARLLGEGGAPLLAVTTHLSDSDNDDWGATRGAQIDQLGAMIAAQPLADVAVLGDFNVDARSAQATEIVLTKKLRVLGGQGWVDLNDAANGGGGLSTVRGGGGAIDHHLVNWTVPKASFETRAFGVGKTGSDHCLTVSRW